MHNTVGLRKQTAAATINLTTYDASMHSASTFKQLMAVGASTPAIYKTATVEPLQHKHAEVASARL